MLLIYGQAIWFKDLNNDGLIPMIYDYIDGMLATEGVVEPSGELANHVYQRYQPTPTSQTVEGLLANTPANALSEEDFDGIDPVCMMTVDPQTAQWQTEYNGKTYYFCAPSCKRSFDKNPTAYIKMPQKSISAEDGAKLTVETSQGNNVNIPNQLSETKVFSVPNISCEHCVRSIRNEITELTGVTEVQADERTKIVTVKWEAPATWDQIKSNQR